MRFCPHPSSPLRVLAARLSDALPPASHIAPWPWRPRARDRPISRFASAPRDRHRGASYRVVSVVCVRVVRRGPEHRRERRRPARVGRRRERRGRGRVRLHGWRGRQWRGERGAARPRHALRRARHAQLRRREPLTDRRRRRRPATASAPPHDHPRPPPHHPRPPPVDTPHHPRQARASHRAAHDLRRVAAARCRAALVSPPSRSRPRRRADCSIAVATV